jgi:hypothetical protein
MNYEIISPRWRCPECGVPVKLYFIQSAGTGEEASDEFVCNRVLCEAGHEIPEDLAQEMIGSADQEFYSAIERGAKVSEVWIAPDPAQEEPLA